MMLRMSAVFACISFVVLTLSMPVTAKNYSAVSAEQQCTDRDLRKIKYFNKKARRQMKEHSDAEDDLQSSTSMGKILKNQQRKEASERFFRSSEYKSMAPIYKRCNSPMPSL